MLPSEEIAASMLLGIGDACAKSGAHKSDSHDDDSDDGSREAAEEAYKEELVTDPGPHDVLCGRGGGENWRCGCEKERIL